MVNEELLNNIKEIITKEGSEIVKDNKDIQISNEISKYSSTKLPTTKLKFKNKILKRDEIDTI
jgi:hypothetical protein